MTEIFFAPLAVPGMGEGTSVLPLVTRGTDVTDWGVSFVRPRTLGVGTDPNEGHSKLTFRSFGTDAVDIGRSLLEFSTLGSGFDIIPDVGVGASAVVLFTTEAETFDINFEDGPFNTQLPLVTRGTDVANWGVSAMKLRTLGNDVPHPDVVDTKFLLWQGMGWLTMTVGFPTVTAPELGYAYDEASTTLTFVASETLNARADLVTKLTGMNDAFDYVESVDDALPILMLIAEATGDVSDDSDAFLNLLMLAVDAVIATDSAPTQLTAMITVAVLAEVMDTALLVTILGADDTASVLDEAAIERIALIVEALEDLAADDAAASTLRFFATATDAADGEDTLDSSLVGLLDAFETGAVVGTVRINGELFAIYAMTLQGAAVSEYDGVSFNSQAVIDGHLYVAGDDGISLLEGPDDAGVDIAASVSVGVSSLGTQLMKSVYDGYIGYTSTGSLLLKVTTDHDERKTSVYKLNPIAKPVTTDNRFSVAKGKKAVYWDFELTNLDGADFELETLQVWRLILSRRK